jgi:SurA-like N-terminal domain
VLKLQVMAGLIAALSVTPMPAAEPTPTLEAPGEEAVLATVDEEPVPASEIDRFLALEGVALPSRPVVGAAAAGGAGRQVDTEDSPQDALRRQVLELVIDERLRAREVDRLGFTELPHQDVEAEVAALRSRFPSKGAFEARLAEVGLSPAALRDRIAHRLLARLFAEERLDPRVRLDPDRMHAYYDEVLVPELRSRGEKAPPFEAARALIGRRMEADLVDRELERWTEELRSGAAIEFYLEPSVAAP